MSVSASDSAAPELEATDDGDESLRRRITLAFLGRPLRSTAIAEERMRKLVALPILSADALSSVAYGPEAMLAILVLGGSVALKWSYPIAGAIMFLMLAVGVSYRQTSRPILMAAARTSWPARTSVASPAWWRPPAC